MNTDQKTINIGQEHDKELHKRVVDTIRQMGGVRRNDEYSVVGSQEWIHDVFEIGGMAVSVERETFVGLTVTGPSAIVDVIESRLEEKNH